jgi:hypothetical protein
MLAGVVIAPDEGDGDGVGKGGILGAARGRWLAG